MPSPCILRLAVSAALVATVGCRFQDKKPTVQVPVRKAEPAVVFSSALDTARELGYRSVEVDEKRRFATFVATYGNFELQAVMMNGAVLGTNTNYLMMKVLDDGKVKAWASGPDVRGDRIDRHLQFELEVFVARVAGHEVVIE
jgi:hypothetical protein